MKQNNTLTWSNDFNKQANFTKVYAHIIDIKELQEYLYDVTRKAINLISMYEDDF